MKTIGQNNKQMSVIWIKSIYFFVNFTFEIKVKQHKNICSQSQTNKCKNTNDRFWIWIVDKHLRFLQVKQLQ